MLVFSLALKCHQLCIRASPNYYALFAHIPHLRYPNIFHIYKTYWYLKHYRYINAP